MTSWRQPFILQSGRKIVVERGWKKHTYHPGNKSLRRCVRLLLMNKFGNSKSHKYRVSSTTGGWENFNILLTRSLDATSSWHREKYPERFQAERPEKESTYSPE